MAAQPPDQTDPARAPDDPNGAGEPEGPASDRRADPSERLRRLEERVRELEEARAELARQEARFRALIEKGMDGVTIVDREGTVLYTSPNSRELLGIPAEERQGRSAFLWMHPDDLERVRAEFEELARTPGGAVRPEFRYRHPGRGWRHLEAVARNLLDDPAVEGIVVNFRDVTRERELEAALERERKLQTVTDLTAGIAHDFNNFLAVVSANGELLRDALPPDAEEARQDLEDLLAAARGGTDLVRTLMTFLGQEELEVRPVRLEPVVEQTGRMLRRIFPSKIRIEWEAPEGLPPVVADPRAVEQLIMSLANNARDAMPAGGELKIRLAPIAPGDEPPGLLALEVADTGAGMDDETLARAFEPFFTTKEAGHGIGLGLATVARLVDQLGGKVEAESKPGAGTRIRILLPVAEKPEAGAADRPGGGGPGDALILLVEDEEALRRTAQRVLVREGYRVVAAPDGAAGLELFTARRDEISLVLSDQDMPGMTGTELLRRIREEGSDVPFVLTTGFIARDLDSEEGLLEGIRVLPKPWSLSELIVTVAEALAGTGG